MTDDDRLSEAEVLQLQTAALACVQANSTPTLVATVERIVAERVREAERRGAAQKLREFGDNQLHTAWEPGDARQVPRGDEPAYMAGAADAHEVVRKWSHLCADRLDRDGSA